MKYATSSTLKFPAGHFIAVAMTDACARPGRVQPWDDRKRVFRKIRRRLKFWQNPHTNQSWGEAGGPVGFTAAIKHFGMFNLAQSPYIFNPEMTGDLEFLTDNIWHEFGILECFLKKSYAIHFHNEYWRQKNLNKNDLFHPDSPFELLKRRYLPELNDGA